MSEPLTSQEVRDLLIGLRGAPHKCDFCGQEKPESELEPEEGGDWVCHDCMLRWVEQENQP